MAGDYRETLGKVVSIINRPRNAEEYFDPNARLALVFDRIPRFLKDHKKRGNRLIEILLDKPELSLKFHGLAVKTGTDTDDTIELGVGKLEAFQQAVLVGFKGRVDEKDVHVQYRIEEGFQYSLFLAHSEGLFTNWINVAKVYPDSYKNHIALVEQLFDAASMRVSSAPNAEG
jgi:hypothetical protein